MKAFNEKYLCKATYKYALVMRKKYIYLEFHCYDPDEFCFPGKNHLNGTIEGAMKTGISAYK